MFVTVVSKRKRLFPFPTHFPTLIALFINKATKKNIPYKLFLQVKKNRHLKFTPSFRCLFSFKMPFFSHKNRQKKHSQQESHLKATFTDIAFFHA